MVAIRGNKRDSLLIPLDPGKGIATPSIPLSAKAAKPAVTWN
jgi:hypothetical protein